MFSEGQLSSTMAAPPSAPSRLSCVAQLTRAVVVPSSSVTREKPLMSGLCLKDWNDRPSSSATTYETFAISGIAKGLRPGAVVDVTARKPDGGEVKFKAIARLDSDVDVEYYRNGGILHTVLRRMAKGEM